MTEVDSEIMMTSKKNKVALSIKIPPNLLVELEEYCEAHGVRKSPFSCQAIAEKIHRKSITENLSIRADTSDIQRVLVQQKELLKEQLSILQTKFDSFQRDALGSLGSKIDENLLLSRSIIDFITQSPSTVSPETNIISSLDERIPSLLPRYENDILLELSDQFDAKTVIESLKRLKKAGKISKSTKGFYRVK